MIISIFFPIAKEEIDYQIRKSSNSSPAEIVPADKDFGIVIPKINANSKVIANVDPFNSLDYQMALSKGVAHAKGTVLPGNIGNMFIFSHSSADFLHAQIYNSIFYLLSKLDKDDVIKIYYQQKEFVYKVIDKRIVGSNEINYLKPNSTEETLTLMTCWPPGTSLKRLIVQAVRKI